MNTMTDLERDIEESRARLDRTIDRLQDKMTATGVADDVLGTARRHGYGPTLDRAAVALRQNPIPVLLIAAGIGWLALSMSETARRRTARDNLRRRGVWDRPPVRHVADDDPGAHVGDPTLHDEDIDPRAGRSATDADIVTGVSATGRPAVTTATPERPTPYAPTTGAGATGVGGTTTTLGTTTSGVRR